jgi:hypothetical protein
MAIPRRRRTMAAMDPLTPHERYFFDLQGYIILRQALSPQQVAACNAVLDVLRGTAVGRWAGRVVAHSYGGAEGLNLQQIYEAGPAFEALIDHPAWIAKVQTLVGGEGTFDWLHGPLFIDECLANIRGPGGAIGLHSGGHDGCVRTQYKVQDGRFHCGQVNVLTALTDIGPGDGGTMVIPGSHKAAFRHPDYARHGYAPGNDRTAEGCAGAIEVHLAAGDALVFVDGISHGSARRVNAGERRVAIYRYGPSWGSWRHPYRPSPDLLARLTPERRRIVQPQDPITTAPGA